MYKQEVSIDLEQSNVAAGTDAARYDRRDNPVMLGFYTVFAFALLEQDIALGAGPWMGDGGRTKALLWCACYLYVRQKRERGRTSQAELQAYYGGT